MEEEGISKQELVLDVEIIMIIKNILPNYDDHETVLIIAELVQSIEMLKRL